MFDNDNKKAGGVMRLKPVDQRLYQRYKAYEVHQITVEYKGMPIILFLRFNYKSRSVTCTMNRIFSSNTFTFKEKEELMNEILAMYPYDIIVSDSKELKKAQ
jgi:hypothetical protein